MNDSNDLNIRVAALAQEYGAHILQLSARAAAIAAELASTREKLAAAEARLSELERA
jgi:hypothetical protein